MEVTYLSEIKQKDIVQWENMTKQWIIWKKRVKGMME